MKQRSTWLFYDAKSFKYEINRAEFLTDNRKAVKMKRAKQKKRARYYEPVTNAQIRKIHATRRGRCLADDLVYDVVQDVIGIPSISALSKREAMHVIEYLVNPGSVPDWRGVPWTGKPKNDEGDLLPYYGHVDGIRAIVQALGWSKDGFKGWLKKYRHVSGIRNMNREQMQKTFVALRKLQQNYQRN